MYDSYETFTGSARQVVELAEEEARDRDHNYIGTEHILMGMVREGEGIAARALASLGVGAEAVRTEGVKVIDRSGHSPAEHIPFTPRAKKVLELSLREALQLGHNYIGTEHILLVLIKEGNGVAVQILVKLGVDLSQLRQKVIELMMEETAKNEVSVPSDPLEELRQRFAERDATIAEVYNLSVERNRRIGQLVEDLAKREKYIVQLQEELAKRDEACARNEAEIAKLQAQLQALEAEGQLATILAELRELSRLFKGRARSTPPQPDLPV